MSLHIFRRNNPIIVTGEGEVFTMGLIGDPGTVAYQSATDFRGNFSTISAKCAGFITVEACFFVPLLGAQLLQPNQNLVHNLFSFRFIEQFMIALWVKTK